MLAELPGSRGTRRKRCIAAAITPVARLGERMASDAPTVRDATVLPPNTATLAKSSSGENGPMAARLFPKRRLSRKPSRFLLGP